MRDPRVALVPHDEPVLADAIRAGGGRVVAPGDADAIVWTDPLDARGLRRLLEESPVRWVQLPFAGIEAFAAAGVIDADRTWTCAKGIYGPATAEHALALMLAAARRLHEHCRAGKWSGSGRAPGSPVRRLKDARVVIVGTGGIGRAVAAVTAPLGADLVAVNRSGRPLPGVRTEPVAALRGLLRDASFVVVAAALTADTRHLFDAAAFEAMSLSGWLINVARGGLVDTAALVAALEAGSIGGAALDVTEPEPLPDDHPLWRMPNVIITPHVANTWDMALPELAALVRRNVERHARGDRLEGLVDVALGY